MKHILKIVLLFLIIIYVSGLVVFVNANDEKKLIRISSTGIQSGTLQSTDIDWESWDPKNKPIDDEDKLVEIGNKVVGPVQIIGSLVSVIAIIIIGIRYMLGSAEEKAEYKTTLGPYFVGAVIVFGITNILGIIYNFAISI